MMTLLLRTNTARAARILALCSLLTATVMAHSRPSLDQHNAHLHKRAVSYQGCYSSSTPLSDDGSYTYQSSGHCGDQCSAKNQAVMGLSGGDGCWCGGQLPAEDDKVEDSNCDSPCTGYGQEDCGGNGFWSIYLTGTEEDVSTYGGGSSSSTKGSSSAGASSQTSATVVTSVAPGETVVVTIPAGADATSSNSASGGAGGSGGGSNTAGIAAGVVVGVVAVGALVGGLIFWNRRKKKTAAEEEYKKRSQVSDFMRGGGERKPPSTGYSHMSDQRLDPEAGKRNSVGSLADANDYSRRILRVANPDSS